MSGSDSSTVHRPQTASVADSRPLWLRRIEEQVHAFDRALWMVPSMARTKLTDDLRAHLLSEADHGGKAPHDSVATAILRLGSMTTMVAGARRLYGLRWELRLLRAVLLGIAVTATTPLVGSMVLLTTPLVILVLALAGMEMGLGESLAVDGLVCGVRLAPLSFAIVTGASLGSTLAIAAYGTSTALLLLPGPLAAHLRHLQLQSAVRQAGTKGSPPTRPPREPRIDPKVTRVLAAVDD